MPALHIEFCCTYKFVLTPHRNMIIAPMVARKHSNASAVFEVHCWGITWIWKWSLFVINHKKSVYFNQSNIVLFMKMIALGIGNSHDCGPLPVHTINWFMWENGFKYIPINTKGQSYMCKHILHIVALLLHCNLFTFK